MRLSTNMSFDSYMSEMMMVLENIDLRTEKLDKSEFDDLLELLVFKLSKTTINWDEVSNTKLNLSFNGTKEGICDMITELVIAVLQIIYDSVPEMTKNLDKHIMNMLLYQFTIRLLYQRSGRDIDPTLGKLKIEHLIPTVQQKPVKLYNVLRESYVIFMSARFPDAIIIEEKLIDDQD